MLVIGKLLDKVNKSSDSVGHQSDALVVQALKQAKQQSHDTAMSRCTDIYMGLDRLFGMGLEYICLDNPKQYRIMCMGDRWIQGYPIVNHSGSLSFSYEHGGKVYQIHSSPKSDGTVLFFVVGDE